MRQLTSFLRCLRYPAFATILLLSIALPIHAQRVEVDEPNQGGTIDLTSQDPQRALETLHPAPGYVVELFASEQDFPIGNPVSLTFDARGRLWVATMPSYPQRLPDQEPNDKLIILEDTDGDGKADKHVVFADNLHLPAGFELGDGGAYVAQQPDLVFLQDTDGDDRADRREVVLHGFGTEDSHHAISAFTWGPGGALYFQEGTFHHSQVETPWGPVRLVDAGVFRYEPQRHWLEVFVSYPFANPWGHVFDRWGQNFIADASGGANYFGTAITGNAPYPSKRKHMQVFTSVVRPTAGCEIVSSRHFPPEAQGNFLVNNTIGFQGIKQHRVIEQGSGFTSEEVTPLLYSTDINFRPVDLQFGPDGALYLVDWWNPLIGHMQYSLRDPRRDNGHGRIWRIRHESRPLLKPKRLDQAPIEELLETLSEYEDRLRYRARRELRTRDRDQVLAAIPQWLESDPGEAAELEALWLHQSLDDVDLELLDDRLASSEPRVRAAATRVLRFWRKSVPDVQQRLEKLVRDPFPRVRLEALLALSYLETRPAAVASLAVLDSESDDYLDYVLGETIDTLKPYWAPALEARGQDSLLTALPDHHLQYLLSRLDSESLTSLPREPAVLRALVLRQDLDREITARALDDLLTTSSSGAAPHATATLIELLAKADALSLSDAVERLGKALVDRPRSSLAAEQSALSEIEASTQLAATLEWLTAIDLAARSEVVSAAELEARSVDQLQLFLRALPRAPASVRQQYYPFVASLSRSLPAPILRQLAEPADAVVLSLNGRQFLRVAEVELFQGDRRPIQPASASQSSMAHDLGASLVIDGNTSGEFGEFAFTAQDMNPWIQVALEEATQVSSVTVVTPEVSAAGAFPESLLSITLKRRGEALFTFEGFEPARDRRIVFAPEHELRKQAIQALTEMPENKPGTAEILTELTNDPAVARAALDGLTSEALRSVPGVEQRSLLATALVREISALPIADLTRPNVRRWLDTAASLATDPNAGDTRADSRRSLQQVLEQRSIQEITIRPVPHQMVFDTLQFTVVASRPVELKLENQDIMPHNLVVTRPGGLEDVGEMAELMSKTDPVGAEARNYIPGFNSLVMFATPLVLPGASAALAFVAPSEPGRYPFVCTFPGHWILMNGIMNVVAEGSDVPPPQLRAASPSITSLTSSSAFREYVQDWTLEQLQPAVEESAQGRWATRAQIENGAKLFVEIGCAQCHQKNGDGGAIGPALDDVGQRFDAVETLFHILEPSESVAEEYETTMVGTRDGMFYSGLEIASDEGSITLQANPLAPEDTVVLERSDIVDRSTSPLSPMPSGLLVTLSEEEILDLLRFVRNDRLPDQP